MTQYACPWCDYTAPTGGSVQGHITGRSDGEHKGKRGPDVAVEDLRVDTEPAESATADGGTADGDPVADAPETDTAATQAGAGDSDEPTCPECGGNRWFDASEHTEYEYGCADCSDESGWIVWNE